MSTATTRRIKGRLLIHSVRASDFLVARLATMCLLFLAPAVVFAATIHVTTTVDALANTGTCSLREAIISANTNAPSGGAAGECPSGNSGSTDTIVLPAGSFNLSLAGSEAYYESNALLGDLDITQSLNLQGQTASTTIINAASLGARVIHIDGASAAVSISGLKIRDGFSDAYGGGIYVADATSLALSFVEVSSNHADYNGGGLAIESYIDATIVGSLIANNTSDDSGGGISYASGGILAMTSSIVSANQANGTYSDGGGIYASGSVILSTCTVASNGAGDSGGGLYISGSLSATNSTISGNSAGSDGGGIYFYYPDASELKNTTISGNSAVDYGGGLARTGSTAVTLTHTTLANNSADLIGGGSAIANTNGMVLKNSAVSGTCQNASATSLGGNLESPGDNCGLNQPTDQVAVTAGQLALGPLAYYGGGTRTHMPAVSSLAVDHARAVYCLAADQRGVARPQGPACDVGAVELEAGALFSDGFESGNTNAWI
jgi:CSLREA domain-containing protein